MGKKFYMAISGAILIGFLVAHMVGNLKMYMGADAFNHYAEFLREVGYPILPHMVGLWIFRVVLLACVGGVYALRYDSFVKLDLFYANASTRKKAILDLMNGS